MKKTAVYGMVWLLLLSTGAAATDWEFYGSARMGVWSVQQSPDWPANPLSSGDHRTTSYSLQTNSRIGARVTADNISGHVEYGLSSARATRLRLLWGQWRFGETSLLVGQSYTPTYFIFSNQVAAGDNGLQKYSHPNLRVPMIEIKYGPFKVAAIQPATGYATDATYTNIRTMLPKLEASWSDNLGPLLVHIGAGYNSVELYSAADQTVKPVSYVLGLMVKYTTGPLTAAASCTYGLNGNEYGDGRFDGVDAAGALIGKDYVKNTAWGVSTIVGYKFNDWVAAEAGYGYVEARRDGWTDSDGGRSYYFQLPITLTAGITITPEYTVFDGMDDETDTAEGTETWLGAKVQINF